LAHTLEEIRLEVDVEDIAAEAFDRVIERQDMDPFAVFDIQTLVNIDEITELHSQVVASHLVNLDTALFDIIGAEADEDCVTSFLSTAFTGEILG
jgi:hypothetical protein